MPKNKKIFLASSSELKDDRTEFELFINRKNKEWVAKGVFIELIVWEDFLDAVSKTRLQDEYKKAIQECDIFIMLFCTKVGPYTEEEFETAFGQFKATNKPFIFTYFKDVAISTGSANKKDLISLWAFRDKLDALGHFPTVYRNTDELKYKFNQQLEKLLANRFIKLKPDNTILTQKNKPLHTSPEPPTPEEVVVGHDKALGALSYYLRQVVCLNQGELPQYSLLANQFHRAVRISSTAGSKDMASIRDACKALQEFLNRNVFRIYDTNFELLKTYFHRRHPIKPRVCVKENLKKGNVYFVRDIKRDEEVNYSPEYKLNANSGFVMVESNGKSYQCNNIPERLDSGEYHNARINSEMAKEYWRKSRNEEQQGSAKKKENGYDTEWIKCWHGPRDRKGNLLTLDPRSCYKSTLIIPMTLWNNKLDDEFRRLMARMETSPPIFGEKGRRIFGYLCLDHIQEDYFDDENIGYIFADLLSLYQLVRLTYTTYSPVLSKAHELLKASRYDVA